MTEENFKILEIDHGKGQWFFGNIHKIAVSRGWERSANKNSYKNPENEFQYLIGFTTLEIPDIQLN